MRKIIAPGFVEIVFLGIIIFVLIFGANSPVYAEISKTIILFTMCYWAILVSLGMLTPHVRHRFNLAFDFNPKDNKLGYPIQVSCESKGGFICGHPIVVKAEVFNIGTPKEKGKLHDIKRLFKDNFKEFSIVWPSAEPYKPKKGMAAADAGKVELDMKKCSGKSGIIFTSPGRHTCRLNYQTTGGVPVSSVALNEEDSLKAFLYISPPEILYQIRVINIIYSLSLIILSFLLRSIL
ncbi:MAG: hypothetical protein ABH914_04715 [Candidatus Omnitrophota bacterium]